MTRVGTVYKVQPQPWEEADTRWVDAGPVKFGVEWRDVDPAALLATYGEGTADMAEIIERSPEGGFFDRGVSIHVCAASSGHEYLRFDVFDDDPHYHYVDTSGEANRVVAFDSVASGEMLPWVLDRLRTRLATMLEGADAGELAAEVAAADREQLRVAVDTVEKLATAARTAGAATTQAPN
jgi:hypothetical protein